MRALLLVVAALAIAGCEFAPSFLGHPTPRPDIGGSGGGGNFESDGCGGISHPGLQTDPVVEPAKAPPPISGGTMVILGDGTVVAADSDRDQLHFYRQDRGVWHAALPAGSEPGRVIEGPRGQVFVALRARSQVAMVTVESGDAFMQPVCASPRGLAFDTSGEKLFVACATGELSTVELRTREWITTTSRPAPDLRDLMWHGSHLWATSFRSAQLWDIDPSTMKATELVGPSFLGNAVTLAPQVAWRAVMSKGSVLMVHQAEQVDAVAQPGFCSSSYGAPADQGGSPTMETVLTTLDGAAASSGVLFGPVLPVDVAVATDGRVAVASAGTNQVFVFLANAPSFALNFVDQPVSVAFQSNGSLWVYSREPAAFTVVDETGFVLSRLPLSDQSVFSTGHQLFHQSTMNAIACASCHPEAGDDGHVWGLPEGTFKTPSLRGGLSGTEPFHWSGEETNMPTLLSDIFVSRMSGAPQTSERTDALLRWLDAQPVRAAPSDLDPQAIARGAQTFQSAGCTACHTGQLGTNNANADVGSGGSFQVPRLVELAYRAPFMHDGRAATLADRFGAAGGTQHGDTSGLSEQQLADLVAYLQTR